MSILTSEMNSLSQFCFSLVFKDIFFYCARAQTFKALEVNFLSAYFFQEYQDKCSSVINEVKIDLL